MVVCPDLEAGVPVPATVAAIELTEQAAASAADTAHEHVFRKPEASAAAVDQRNTAQGACEVRLHEFAPTDHRPQGQEDQGEELRELDLPVYC